MIRVSTLQLQTIMPFAAQELRISKFVDPLNAAMNEFGISTAPRQAAFLAQVAHESGELRYVLELADGKAYEKRLDLGNDRPGDGPRYKGRGLLQITGKGNYAMCGAALGLALVLRPELLEEPMNAARSAGWFWNSRSLNKWADNDHFGTLTRTINGGFNGLDSRIEYWLRARRALGIGG